MAGKFSKGDRVEWNSGTGTATGEIQQKITERTDIDGHTVDASEDDPRYLVKNDNTGNVTGHTGESLSKVSESSANAAEPDGQESLTDEQAQTLQEFQSVVNMTARQIRDWLQTDNSQSVGQDAGDGEAKGHKSGRQIADILEKPKSDYTDSDFQHMNTVVGYVHRHTAQRPSGNIEDTDWRYSLMNWGHDPLKS